MKCNRCGSEIRTHESDEGKRMGYIGPKNYCSPCWTAVKTEMQKSNKVTEALSAKYGVKARRVKKIRRRSINRTKGDKEMNYGGWTKKDIIRR